MNTPSDANSIDVRAAEGADEEDVISLWREAFPGPHTRDDMARDFRRKLNYQPELLLIARCRGRVVAVALGGDDGHRGHVHAVAVAAAYRRQGVGRRLFDELISRLKARGCEKLIVMVQPDNTAATAFYRSLGFRLGTDICLALGIQ